ncbi:GNAT family N-acetyltransferase [Nocardiopsis potens]|uniref:GNAT family N-acetyltransferase n=1 Tax=Nocardiopsis potens TaxID=1246458 RepID=UPI0003484272|nr:GNAT family N-acetyltransferase [Nocardiopsis potens]
MAERNGAPEPVVREAGIGDMEAVAGIYAHYVESGVATFDEEPRSADDWRARFKESAERGLPFLVAEVGGEIAGYAGASPWKPKAAYRYTVENSVYLAPGRTGGGLGRLLMERFLKACTEAGLKQVVAVIADTPDGAQGGASRALHARLGFTEVGRMERVGYKHGMWVDTVIMQRALA